MPFQTKPIVAIARTPVADMRPLMFSAVLVFAAILAFVQPALGQGRGDDAYRPPADGYSNPAPVYQQPPYPAPANQGSGYQGPSYQPPYAPPQAYRQPPADPAYGEPPPRAYDRGGDDRQGGDRRDSYPPQNGGPDRGYANNDQRGSGGYGQPYAPPPAYEAPPPPRYSDNGPNPTRGYYEQGEIVEKGRGFFGSITQGLASAIEHTYRKAGRPNGYILGEDGGGAFFAGLRYGEGVLYTKDAGDHKVFWQGPSLGFDIGGEGSKVMILVYNLADTSDIFDRYAGVEGSTYAVGGVSVQFQKHADITLAVIRSGIGLRLGANVGYSKFTRRPTWNPF
jgi:hypothetical protein